MLKSTVNTKCVLRFLFDPAFIGQLGVSVAAINHQKKKETDNEPIGLLICKTKDDVMAEYLLEASSQPIGISESVQIIPLEFPQNVISK